MCLQVSAEVPLGVTACQINIRLSVSLFLRFPQRLELARPCFMLPALTSPESSSHMLNVILMIPRETRVQMKPEKCHR